MGIVGGLAVVEIRRGLTQKANKLLLNANILGSIRLLKAVKVRRVLTWTKRKNWLNWERIA